MFLTQVLSWAARSIPLWTYPILGMTWTIFSPSRMSLKYSGSFSDGCTGPKGMALSTEYCVSPALDSLRWSGLVSSLKPHHLPYLLGIRFLPKGRRRFGRVVVWQEEPLPQVRVSLEGDA